jgi:hypothetical protein
MTDIFLSYNEKDRETARRVAAVLEAVGWTVWWDRRIPAGETWRSVLDHALENMRCMIVLWSSRSIKSEWVYEEASEGRRQDKLVPVLIEAVRPPAGFREIQAADLTEWDGSREFEGMRLLIDDLEHLLGKPGVGVKSDPAQTNDKDTGGGLARVDHGRPYIQDDPEGDTISTERLPQRRSMTWVIAGGLLLAGMAAYFALSARDTTVKPPQVTEVPRRIPASAEPTPATPEPPVKTMIPQESAAVPDNPTATPSPTIRPLRERPLTVKRADITRATSSRCTDLLNRVQLGETLSEETQSVFRKECQQ